jgi:guanine deaminase
MTGALLCAAVLPSVDGSAAYWPDAYVAWRDGVFVEVRVAGSDDGPHSGQLVTPGFCDLHIHWPQAHVRGRFSGALLPWLRDHIWPAEAAFADAKTAEARADAFIDVITRAGTLSALTFGPPFLAASLAFLARAPRGFFDGPALMERNCPDDVSQAATSVLDAMADAGPLRDRLVVSPRFAPNMTRAGMDAAGRFAREHGLPAQSHLSENVDEIAWVAALYPEARDYTDVYDQHGLLGGHVVLAHGVHLSDAELARLAATQTIIAHCPTSNEALGSGRMAIERLRDAGVRWVLATDVGAGPEVSLLHVIDRFLAVHAAAGVDVDGGEALCRATAIPGAFLAQFDPGLVGLGALTVGAPAHLVIFDLPSHLGDGPAADDVVRALCARHRGHYELAPRAVVRWGENVDFANDD